MMNVVIFNGFSGVPPHLMDRSDVPGQSYCLRRNNQSRILLCWLICLQDTYGAGGDDFSKTAALGWAICPVPAARRSFPPEVAIHVVKLACEMPDHCGRSVSLWDCEELRKQLIADGVINQISTETIRRILNHHKLKPWRMHFWLGKKTPRDEHFHSQITEICELYTRDLSNDEVVLCFDEKTSLQPRIRLQPSLPAKPGQPVLVEHEYKRSGALNLFAAFNTRTGKVLGQCYKRKRAAEFIDFMNQVDQTTSPEIKHIHIVLDNLKTHKTKAVQEWLAKHPRFHFHFTPVHCSWMNQVEQWFGILQRKRFRIADFASIEDMERKIMNFIDEHNNQAHPFNWTTKSVTKIMAAVGMPLQKAS